MTWRMAGGEVHIGTCEPSITVACVCILILLATSAGARREQQRLWANGGANRTCK